MKRLALGLAALVFSVAGARGEEQEFTPEFGALEGAELTHTLSRSFDAYKLPTGRFTREAQPAQVIEGAVREFVYRLEGETSTLEAVRNYQRRFAELGYQTLFECAGEECGGFDFRFNTYLVEPPAMRFDLADFRFLAVEDAAKGRGASVIASRQGGRLFVQIVAVEGESAPEKMTAAGEAPPPAAKPGLARLYALVRRLTEDGHAALDDVAFEAGSARLTAASEPVLAQVAEVLRERPDLKFLVIGHTDNQGGYEQNMALSRQRAESVAARLAAAEGVAPAQVTPHGVGYLSPRASNATAEGRAANRRVELVLN
ncbi:MAG: OmpA family protein [Pikeienuella sp.]